MRATRPAVEAAQPTRPLAGIRLPLALLCLTVLLVYATLYLLYPIVPLHLRALGFDQTSIGWLMGLFSVASLLLRPISGLLADRIGRRPLILTGSLMIGGACVAYLWLGRDLVFLARILHGLGWGVVSAVTATVAVDLAPPQQRGMVLGIYGMTTGLVMATGPSIGLWLSDLGGNGAAFSAAALAALAGAGASLLLRVPAPPAGTQPLTPSRSFSPQALGPAALCLCFMLAYGAVMAFVPLVALDRHLGSPGPFFTLFAVALVFLRLAGGGLSDRWGRAWVIIPGCLCGAAATVLLALADTRLLFLAAALPFAVAFAFIQPTAQAWAVDRCPPNTRGTTLATVVAAQDLGIALGSLAAGALADTFGYAAVFLAAAAPCIAALLIAAYVTSVEQQKED